MTISNAGAWPTGVVKLRVLENGTPVEVAINWNLVRWLARKALVNKGRKATSGPVTVRVATLTLE